MTVRRFDCQRDLEALESFLRDRYLETRRMSSWLPERLHDLIFRLDQQYLDDGGERSSDYIFLWEEQGQIVGCLLPDGDAVYLSLKPEYEALFSEIVSYAEVHCLPLFSPDEEGKIDFLVISNDSLTHRSELLCSAGYTRQTEEDYDNFADPSLADVSVSLPEGYRLAYGDEYPEEENKWSACNMGFHPELESPDYRNGMSAYQSRKGSSLYADSFECLVLTEDPDEPNPVCAYSFVYVDLRSKTAFIEPVSTRERWRHRGFGTAMMHGILGRCRELGVEKCYVNSYDWRRAFYNAAGFQTEDSVGFWHKTILRNEK